MKGILLLLTVLLTSSCERKVTEEIAVVETLSDEVRMQNARTLPPLAIGDELPDYVFVKADGKTVRLSDYRGRVLAFTFFFTTCPYSNMCPLLSENMAKVQEQLLKASEEGWQLASITIDPANDTPERMKGYAAQYHANTEHWDFLTGDLVDISALGWQFGLEFWRTNPEQPINHNTRTVVVDAEGRVRWIGTEAEWKPEEVVREIRRALPHS